VPASLEASRLRRLGIGLWCGLPYALAHSRTHANVADTTAASASASASNPLSLKIIVSLIAIAPHALHITELPAIAFSIVTPVVHRVRILSLEREALHVSIHAVHPAVHPEPARTRNRAAVTAPAASAAAARHGFAPRVDCAEKRTGCHCENKNDFCTHEDCLVGGAINCLCNGRTNRPLEANHKAAGS